MGAQLSAMINSIGQQEVRPARNLEASPRYPIPLPPYEELKPFVDEVLHYRLPFVFSVSAISKLHPELEEQRLAIIKAKREINTKYTQSNIHGYCLRLKYASVELLDYLKHGTTVPLIALLARIYSLDSCKEVLDGLSYRRTDWEELSRALGEAKGKNEIKVLTYAVDLARYSHDFPTHCPECQADLPQAIIPGDQVVCPKCKREISIPFTPQVEQVEPERLTSDSIPVRLLGLHLGIAIEEHKDEVSHTPFTFLEYAALKLEELVDRFVSVDMDCRDSVLAKVVVQFVQRLGPLAGYFELNNTIQPRVYHTYYKTDSLNWIPAKAVNETNYDLVYRLTWLSNEFNIPLRRNELLLFLDALYPPNPDRIHYRRMLIELMDPSVNPLDMSKVRELVHDMVTVRLAEHSPEGHSPDMCEYLALEFISVVVVAENGFRRSTHPKVVESIVQLMCTRGVRPDITMKGAVFTTLFTLQPIPNVVNTLRELNKEE